MTKILIVLLSLILLLWLSLGIFRASGIAEIEAMQQAYVEHYQEHEDDHVQWDFEKNELVEVPDSNFVAREGESGMAVLAVREKEDAPLEAYAMVLGRIPSHLFHGLFGFASLILTALYVRARW